MGFEETGSREVVQLLKRLSKLECDVCKNRASCDKKVIEMDKCDRQKYIQKVVENL